MWTVKFWLDLLERSSKATAWAAFGTLGAGATGTITGVDWLGVLNVAGFVFVVAALGNFLGAKVGLGAPNSASFLPETVDPPAPRKKRGTAGYGLIEALLAVFIIIVILIVLLKLLNHL